MPDLYNRTRQITIIGAGSWGTAIAKVIAENHPGYIVKVWAYEKSTASSINLKNQNIEFLPDIRLPYNVKATSNLRDSVSGSSAIIIATPSKALPDTVHKLSLILKEKVPVAYLTKGFCKVQSDILTISQTISRIMPEYKKRVVGISGPSHAEEVARYYHTTLSVAGLDPDDRSFFSNLLNCSYLLCRETDDIIGVDLGGTLKNPAAIAAGLISKLPYCGDNLAGALITESQKEMIRLGNFLGARPETIIDISGAGDLVSTALSNHSRNRRFGKDIAKQILEKGTILTWADRIYLRFKPEYVLEKFSKKLHYLAEGAYAIEPLIELAKKNNISIPVYHSLYEVLLNKRDPSLLIETIKDPDKFELIYKDAKVLVKDRKRGLEKVRGKAFKKFIAGILSDKFSVEYRGDNGLKDELIAGIKNILTQERIAEEKISDITHADKKEFMFKDEIRLLHEFVKNPVEKNFNRIVILYLNEIIDHYNSFFYKLFTNYMSFKYYLNKLNGFRNKISITGNSDNLHNFSESVNIIYAAKFKNSNDFIYYLYCINKLKLPIPRFFIPSEVINSHLKRFILRKCGGFIIHRSKLDNVIYFETLMAYLSTLAGHGVPFLYFPELQSSKRVPVIPDEMFFAMLNDVLFKESTEIVLVPSEITYKNRLDESGAQYIFKEQVIINFSSPLFLSEYTKKSNDEISIAQLISRLWTVDERVMPYQIICGVLSDNNYSIKVSDLKKAIKKYITKNNIPTEKPAKVISTDGIKFLIKNSIISRENDYIKGRDINVIEKYSSIIKNRFSDKAAE